MRLTVTALFLVVAFAVSAPAKAPAKKKTAKSPAVPVSETLKQMERDWSQAGVKKDFATLDRIIADDWISIDSQGQSTSKAQAIAALRSSDSSNQSIRLGEMKVRVYGTAAIVTGTDVETSAYMGKDRSGKYTWMDVFVKRDGRWQAVASQASRIEK